MHLSYQDDGKKIQLVIIKRLQFQPQDGASTVPGTSLQLKKMLHAIFSLNPSAALRGLFASYLVPETALEKTKPRII